jgi:HPt (histidine-containing phosphotransfer) domain-containing protein
MTQLDDRPFDPADLPFGSAGVIPHTAPPCDVEAFIERVGGDVELAREMALLFVPDALRLLDGLASGVAANDAERLRQDAHALKGSAGNFDAAPTVAAALALEMMGKSGDIAGAPAVMDQLRVDLAALIEALRTFAESQP